MVFKVLLGISVAVCVLGVLYRLACWFSQGLQPAGSATTTSQRVLAALGAIPAALFSSALFRMVRTLFVDLVFLKRTLDKSLLRWFAHSLIVVGFIALFLMHALDSQVTEAFFRDYQSTLNPYLFLRNLFGVMVLVGLGLATYRRLSLRSKRLRSSLSDWAALIFIGVIIFSGVLLEGAKIRSYTVYQEMVDDYAAFSVAEDELALEAFWVAENGLRSPNFDLPPAAELIAQGIEVNEGSCIECHASNRYAFASFSLAGLTSPFTALLGDAGAVAFFWYLHIVACLAFLAWLPFSKMFHILAAPVSLLIRGVKGDAPTATPANLLNRQMIGLSACTHCGACSLECSSGMFYEHFHNDFILPSEKVQYLKRFAAGKEKDLAVAKQMQQGLYICTSCDRCTTVCPSGINLRELFVHARYHLLAGGAPETTLLSHFSFPLALARQHATDHLLALKKVTELFRKSFHHLAELTSPLGIGNTGKDFPHTSFKGCYSCQRCSNICPVVRSYDNPVETLGMLPHQIMFSLGIGRVDLAMGAQMIWSCSTCYLCQEHCPNQVELCDIFYSLKNGAIAKIEAGA
ncbi:MAG: 4Fe-4S dicluster domain-containing protein [Desulforhopalus sp.]|nr:4Fe-4S dicluster domain-containing protein [Desulforhopalus sp.]